MLIGALAEGLAQLVLSWSNVFIVLAADLEPKILVAYRNILGSLVTIFISVILSLLYPGLAGLLFGREKFFPKLTWKEGILLAGLLFLCGFLGQSFPQNLNVKSLTYLDPKWASVMSYCAPLIGTIITLLVSSSWDVIRHQGLTSMKEDLLALMKEGKFSERLKSGWVNVVGLIIWGAAVLIDLCYEGPVIFHSRVALHATPSTQISTKHGVLLSILASVSTAFALILQGHIYKKYPFYFFNMTMVNFMGAIQATLYALFTGNGQESWKLSFDHNLLAVIYLGLVCSGIMTALKAYSMLNLGPEIESGFSSVALILSIPIGPLIISDGKLHLGSVLTGIVVFFGWWYTMWHKVMESESDESISPNPEVVDNIPRTNADVELGIRTPENSISMRQSAVQIVCIICMIPPTYY